VNARPAGVHPYLVPPAHTAFVRSAVGPSALVAPEQAVVLDADRGRGLEIARTYLAGYLALEIYTNNLLRLGFSEDDVAGGGSDRLVDAIVAVGDLPAIGARIQEHRDAGADHVCLQVLRADQSFPRQEWRELATL
jgi:probable F420-dependent oxidoreductase